MRQGDRVYTPRFCTVQIAEVYGTETEAKQAGYTEPTYWRDIEYGILGKSLDAYHMRFAGYHK